MRTTILLNDELAARLREQAHREGKSFSVFLADAGRKALQGKAADEEAPFRLVTFRGTGPIEGVDLDRIGEIEAGEDVRHYGKDAR